MLLFKTNRIMSAIFVIPFLFACSSFTGRHPSGISWNQAVRDAGSIPELPEDYIKRAKACILDVVDPANFDKFQKEVDVRVKKHNGSAYWNFAYSSHTKGRLGVALPNYGSGTPDEDVEKALTLDAAYVPALALKAILELEKNKINEARKYVLKAEKLKPDDIDLMKAQGLFLMQEKKYKEAIIPLKKYMDRNPSDMAVLYALKWSYENAGDRTAARSLYRGFLAHDSFSRDKAIEASPEAGKAITSRPTDKKVQTATRVRLVPYNGKLLAKKLGQGRFTVVYVWASWCHYCLQTLPSYVKTSDALENDVDYVFLAMDGNLDAIQKHAFAAGLSSVYWVDPEKYGSVEYSNADLLVGEICPDCAVNAVPANFLFDRKGKLIDKNSGYYTTNWMKRKMAQTDGIK